MGTTTTVTTENLARLVRRYADALGTYQEEINALNVYPVPDGDTGTNLRLTLESVTKALEGSDDVPQSIIRGSLMGARGNSGVILSQILRGVAEEVAEVGELNTAALTRGLRRATDLAYQAVMEPQEGTILTVCREAAEEAQAVEGEDMTELTRKVVDRARDALARTPTQLEVLAKAGVVDAGGRGFLLLLECLLEQLDGTELPGPKVPARSPAEALASEDGQTAGAEHHEGSLEFKFEVQFLFDTDDDEADAYRRYLHTMGDCVLVVGGQGFYNVHVHTNEVGPVIEEAIRIGRPKQIDVTYMEGQVTDAHTERVLAQMKGEAPEAEGGPLDEVGVAAVAAGDGILAIFRSLGVKGLVAGGQTFNPSAEQILDGIRAARGENVIVLPNNKNVIGAAKTAAQIATSEGIAKRVEVLPTESPLQAFTALVCFDADASFDENVETMTSEGLRTKHGEVAHAVRASDTPAGHVEQGQCLGLCDGEVCVVADDPQQTVFEVLETMLAPEDSLVTLVYGADIDEWSAHELGKRVAERFGVEVEVHRGGQPHYPFLIGVE